MSRGADIHAAPGSDTVARKWAALYALCRPGELRHEAARLALQHAALVAAAPVSPEALAETDLRRRLVDARLAALDGG